MMLEERTTEKSVGIDCIVESHVLTVHDCVNNLPKVGKCQLYSSFDKLARWLRVGIKV